jgi:hypothetical protein
MYRYISITPPSTLTERTAISSCIIIFNKKKRVIRLTNIDQFTIETSSPPSIQSNKLSLLTYVLSPTTSYHHTERT